MASVLLLLFSSQKSLFGFNHTHKSRLLYLSWGLNYRAWALLFKGIFPAEVLAKAKNLWLSERIKRLRDYLVGLVTLHALIHN